MPRETTATGGEEVTPKYFDERIATNLRHMFFAIQAVAAGMIAAGGGSIIDLGSGSRWRAGGGFPAYTTAKAAVHGLTRGMARDLGPHRIRVNTLVPGWTMTERQKRLWVTPAALTAQRAAQCLPDPIEPVFVARMALFLASDDAAMCTAIGYTAWKRVYPRSCRLRPAASDGCCAALSIAMTRRLPTTISAPLRTRTCAILCPPGRTA